MIKKYLMTGLVLLLPFMVTMWIIGAIIDWLTLPFSGISQQILISLHLQEHSFLFLTPSQVSFILEKALILGFLFLFILTIGVIGKHYIIACVLQLSDAILLKIPFISSIYETTQKLITTICTSNNQLFKKVVLVPFPHQDCLTIGFITAEENNSDTTLPVFVPTSPSPISGYIIFYEKKHIKVTDLSTEEALRYLLTCGTVPISKNFSLPTLNPSRAKD
jgi:uncharacterized membrane protein